MLGLGWQKSYVENWQKNFCFNWKVLDPDNFWEAYVYKMAKVNKLAKKLVDIGKKFPELKIGKISSMNFNEIFAQSCPKGRLAKY